MIKKDKLTSILVHAFLIVGVIVSIFPFYWLIVMSTNETSAVFSSPPHMLFGDQLMVNIRKVFDNAQFFKAITNTLFVVVVTTGLKLFFDSLAGFAFAKFNFPAKSFLFVFILATMMIPGQLSLVPQFIIMKEIGWLNDFKALIVPHVVNAFGIFWIRQYAVGAIHDDLIAAARIDGCNTFRLYWNVALPVIRPALAFLGIVAFMDTWQDYLWPLVVLNTPDKFTIMIALAQLKTQYSVDYAMVMAGALMATVPLIVMFLATARQFIAGISDGAIK